MATVEIPYPRFERSGFASAAVATCVILFLVGIAPRNERALFLKDDSQLPAKALTAVVAPLDAVRSQVEKSLLRGAGALTGSRSSRSGDSSTNAGRPRFVASNTPVIPGAISSLLSNAGTPGAGPGATAADTPPPSGTTPAPTGGQAPTSTPQTTPGTPTSPPGLPAPAAGVIAAIPEPSTWAMMLLGFFAVGGVIRRRAPVARQLA